MKKTLVLLLFPICAHSQVSPVGRIGYSAKEKMFVSGAIYLSYRGITLAPEFVLYPSRSSPIAAGTIVMYSLGKVTIGVGRHFYLYSTDEYDKYKNGFKNTYFAQYKISEHVFLQIGYPKTISIGIK